MKVKQLVLTLTAAVLSAATLAGCANTPAASGGESVQSTGSTTSAAAKTDINVFAIKGPTGVGMVHLMDAQDKGTASNNYHFTVVGSPEEVQAKIINNEADIAAVPTNLAAALFSKTNGNISLLAVNTLGVLYMMENGESIQSVADLKGKTIYSTGQGANPEYVLDYILTQNGLDPDKDVTIEFVEQNDELATLVATGKAEVAMVPEPNVTSIVAKNSDIRVALNMTEEWDKVTDDGSKLMMGCVIVRNAFAQEHPEAVDAFLAEYEASIQGAEDIEATAALCETYGIIPKAAIAKQAIPRCNLTFVSGDAMMNQIKGYYDVLFAANPKSIGGKLPDDSFYYKK